MENIEQSNLKNSNWRVPGSYNKINVIIQNHIRKIAAMQLSFAHVVTSPYKLCQMSLRMHAFDVHIVIICMALNSYKLTKKIGGKENDKDSIKN